ncbi:hypothetical protein [Streptomyces sp. YIM S03343]
MPESYKERRWVAAVVLAVVGAAITTWWLLRDPTPYSLHKTPTVKVTISAVKGDTSDPQKMADDVALLVKVYVQRLEAGDAADLARIGPPWYTGREKAAQQLITRYSAHAGEPVKAIVQDPLVPYLAQVELRFSDGQKQMMELTRDHDDVWWLDMGQGDPVP